MAKARDGGAVVQARHVTNVPIGQTAHQWLRSLKFEQVHEVLRVGRVWSHENVIVSVFQVCTRASEAEAWSAVDDDGVWVVEAVAMGEQIKLLVPEVDAWADTFEGLGVALAPVVTA